MTLPVRNPRTGQNDYGIDPLSNSDVRTAATRLRAAQTGWVAKSAEERADALHALANAVAERRAAIWSALTIDTGRRALSGIEVDAVIGMMHRWAEAGPRLLNGKQPDNRDSAIPGITLGTRLVPYPLVGVISPWNFPLILALIDALPALSAGCAVIVKPSEVTPRFIAPLRDAIAAVPDLADVLLLAEGDGTTGAAIVETVDYIAFTGSVATGRKVGEAAARAFIPASLELGGKDPMIVLASADPVEAAGIALRASVVNSGQACQSIERVYVARAILQPFLDALVVQAQAVRLNAGDIGQGDIGPFISAAQAGIVKTQIDAAVAAGAKVLSGGEVEVLDGGSYLRPTVITGTSSDMAIIAEETFGPVIPVTPFDTVDEAVALANAGKFGLSASVLAGSTAEAEEVAVRIDAGAVSINDGALTTMVWDAEKSSFAMSGMGPSRMGDQGLLRFLRQQALIRQTGRPLPLSAYAEETAR